jgi:mono/diheme cytochrome c family protein
MKQVNPSPSAADSGEPGANWRSVPVWLLILVLLLIYWGMLYFDQHGGWFSQEVYTPFHSEAEVAFYQPSTEGPNLRHGEEIFKSVCGLCHNDDGMGKPNQAPPLAGSEWVLGGPTRLIRIPLYGLNGPITVKGQKMVFPAAMPPIAGGLPAEDVADLLSWMRQAWGNKASPITPEQIKAVKTQVGNHPQAFTPEELLEVLDK